MIRKFTTLFTDVTKTGTKIPKEEYLTTGKNIIIDQGKDSIAGYTDRQKGIFKEVPVIVFGDHTRIVKYVDKPFFLGADGVKVLKSKEKESNYKYLYYALKAAHIPNTGYNRHFKWLKQININYPDFNEQKNIVDILDSLTRVIKVRQKELAFFDKLIKARFVEMFGDPVIEQKFKDKYSMTEVCQIIDGDRGKNYPHNDDFSNSGYCLFLNAKNVTTKGFNFENQMYISQKKDSELKKGKLRRGDIVLTTRGTIGNLAFYDSEIPFKNIRINSGMVIIRLDANRINEMFFIEQFKMQLFKVKQKIASGTAQPQLPISTMNNIKILLPPLSLQNEFANFVHQVDKSKVAVQKSLDETQKLFDSLMQEYFG